MFYSCIKITTLTSHEILHAYMTIIKWRVNAIQAMRMQKTLTTYPLSNLSSIYFYPAPLIDFTIQVQIILTLRSL